MRRCSAIILLLFLVGPASAGPPEAVPPTPAPEELEATIESLRIKTEQANIQADSLQRVLRELDESLKVVEISIENDSIAVRLSNDSLLVFSNLKKEAPGPRGKDVFHVGGDMVVDENQTIDGDIVSAFGDVTVKGTVEGGVLTFSGDIYVTSTGYIKDGAIALSGKVKKDPGGRIGTLVWGTKYPVSKSDFVEREPFRAMGYVLFIIYIVWMILAATVASVFKKNVAVVMADARRNLGISFLKGYATYFLIVAAFVVILLTILGIPVALLGVPVAALAAFLVSFAATSYLLGQKILHVDDLSFKTFAYGSLALGAIPGLFFLVLMLTGSLVIMIFSWILVFAFISVVIPVGLGAVLNTRYGIRPKSKPAAPQQAAGQPQAG